MNTTTSGGNNNQDDDVDNDGRTQHGGIDGLVNEFFDQGMGLMDPYIGRQHMGRNSHILGQNNNTREQSHNKQPWDQQHNKGNTNTK